MLNRKCEYYFEPPSLHVILFPKYGDVQMPDLLTRGQTSFCMHLATSMFLCSCSFATKSSSVQRRVQRRFRGLRQRQWWWHRKQRWSFEGNSRPTQWSSGGTVKSYSSLVIQQIAGSTFVCDDLVVGLRVYPCVLGLGFSCHWYDCIAWSCVCSVQADHMVVLIGHRRRKTPRRFLISPLWQRFCGRFYLKCCSCWIGPNLSQPFHISGWPSSVFIPCDPRVTRFTPRAPRWTSALTIPSCLTSCGRYDGTIASGLDQQPEEATNMTNSIENSYWNWHLNWHLYQFLLVFVAQFMREINWTVRSSLIIIKFFSESSHFITTGARWSMIQITIACYGSVRLVSQPGPLCLAIEMGNSSNWRFSIFDYQWNDESVDGPQTSKILGV